MKKLLAVLMVALMVLGLAACGGSPSSSAPPVASQPDAGSSQASQPQSTPEENLEPVTIKFANYAILEEAHTEFWEQVKADFEAKYPHITIEWVTAPYGEIVQQVINMAGGGDRVDIINGEIDWAPGLADSGLIAPVTDILSADYLADFYPNIMEAYTIDGKVYGLPQYVGPYVLYYNKDLFTQAGLDPEKPPTTYDEMMVMAEELAKLTDADGNKVYAFGQTTASVPVSGSSLTSMVFNFGGQVLDDAGNLSVDNDGFKEAFTLLQELENKGYNPQNAKLKDLRNLFALGQLAMYYDQSWGFAGVQAINPDAADFAATAKPLSGGSGSGQSIIQAHSLFLVDNGPEKNDAVAKLVEYILTTDVLGPRMSQVTLAYPAKKGMEGAVDDSPILAGALGSAENTKTQPGIAKTSDLNLELCTLAQAVTVSKTEVDTAIANFKTAAEALLAD